MSSFIGIQIDRQTERKIDYLADSPKQYGSSPPFLSLLSPQPAVAGCTVPQILSRGGSCGGTSRELDLRNSEILCRLSMARYSNILCRLQKARNLKIFCRLQTARNLYIYFNDTFKQLTYKHDHFSVADFLHIFLLCKNTFCIHSI